jgi:hypothetical protein
MKMGSHPPPHPPSHLPPHPRPHPSPPPRPARHARRPRLLPVLLAAALGVGSALLVACGGTGKGLIPVSAAGPLQSDFEAVRQAAEAGNGSCTDTEAALRKTEEDFSSLPSSVDAGLRSNLRQGISNLRVRAHELCLQPLVQTTSTATTPTTTTTTTPTTTTTTTPTTTTPTTTTPTTPTTTGSGGGTAAPGSGENPSGSGGGTGAGEEEAAEGEPTK